MLVSFLVSYCVLLIRVINSFSTDGFPSGRNRIPTPTVGFAVPFEPARSSKTGFEWCAYNPACEGNLMGSVQVICEDSAERRGDATSHFHPGQSIKQQQSRSNKSLEHQPVIGTAAKVRWPPKLMRVHPAGLLMSGESCRRGPSNNYWDKRASCPRKHCRPRGNHRSDLPGTRRVFRLTPTVEVT